MILTYKFKFYPEETFLVQQCKISKNLYNQTLYAVKQELDKNGKWLRYSQLNNLMRKTVNLEGTINYRMLKTQVAQQVLRQVDSSVSSYFRALKVWKKSPDKFHGIPRFSHYKFNHNILQFTNQACSIKNGEIRLSKDYSIKIPQYEKFDFSKFNQIRIVPKRDCFDVEIIYERKEEPNKDLNYVDNFASIDLGLNNLVTMVGTNIRPVIISGKLLKSYNCFYNKQKAKLISIKDSMRHKGFTNKLYRIEENRNNFMKDALHKVSRKIVNHLLNNKIGTLVVGSNKGWKDSINLGHRTNQTFVSIPHSRLVDFLRYKCGLVGIRFLEVEESYTSKCSALDLEPVQKHETYLGKRKHRGLFISHQNKAINADVNGAVNILRKLTDVVDESITRLIVDSGLLFRPAKIRNLFSDSLPMEPSIC